IRNGPEAPTSEPKMRMVTVVVEKAVVSEVELKLKSGGEVLPRRRTAVSAEVGGRLSFVHDQFETGETFEGGGPERRGDLLLQIDRADYEAALAAGEATLADARLMLTMEEARKAQAMRDWLKIGNGEEASELVKRIPQIASAKAKIAAAEAALEKAKRDLNRTEIRVPYDCRLERTYVDVGSTVTPGMPLVDLVSLGAVEVRLPLSLEDYGYLMRKDGGITGEVEAIGRIGGKTVNWNGRIIRSEEMVERTTRSINVVAEFGTDGGDAPPIGMFVQAFIRGKTLSEVVRVPRSAMIDGDNVLLAKEGRLDIRPVEVLRTETAEVIVRGGSAKGEVPAGAQIVITPPNSPVQNRRIAIEEPAGGESDTESEEKGEEREREE
ncbi:MAG: efflux RND transporter periplasmic adaptor subunit, partial [Roseibacillus sp.]|nr:efflux RND transporter periplasmic adaptor subunit [Roseibacillus sp.]